MTQHRFQVGDKVRRKQAETVTQLHPNADGIMRTNHEFWRLESEYELVEQLEPKFGSTEDAPENATSAINSKGRPE